MHHAQQSGQPEQYRGLLQSWVHYRSECGTLGLPRAKPAHQLVEEALLLILIAAVNTAIAGMPPQFGRDEEKPQPGNDHGRVSQFADR